MIACDIVKSESLSFTQLAEIDRLWNIVYPVQLNDRFDSLMTGLSWQYHYVIAKNESILAWAMIFEKGGETRFSILVHPDFQKKGLGIRLIKILQSDYSEFFGWAIDSNDYLRKDGEKYVSPLGFYLKNNFILLPQERFETENLSAVKICYRKQDSKQEFI